MSKPGYRSENEETKIQHADIACIFVDDQCTIVRNGY